MRKISKMLLLSMLLVSVLFSSPVSADIGPLAEITPDYPGTNIKMRAGDVLYSSKNWSNTSAFVGHVAIVGTDLRIYHVSAANDSQNDGGGKVDKVDSYRSRHNDHETITIYRPRLGGSQAAAWAQSNYKNITSYWVPVLPTNNLKLSSLNPNYCSKFVWQAFYYGNNNNDYFFNISDNNELIVFPSHLTTNSQLVKVGTFSAT